MHRLIKYIGVMVLATIMTSSICTAAEQEKPQAEQDTMEGIIAETHDNLDKYLDYLGQQSDDGTFDGLDELLKNNEVYIMYMGGGNPHPTYIYNEGN